MVLESGTLIGARYRLERLIAEGGMGVVWAAEDTQTGGRCAVKLMKDASNPHLRDRFLHEGRMARTVTHDNVVRILEVIEPENGPPAIIMELLDGESLRSVLERDRRLTLAGMAQIMVPVVSAVGTAHARGIVHRDLKPENVFLVTPSQVVKVLDFGIARQLLLDGAAQRSTGNTTGVVWGTPRYMSPEQVHGLKSDHRADIWALGIIFYECLAGACPTQADDVFKVLDNVASKPFEPLRQIVPDLPEDIAQLVTRMLSRNPSERPSLREVHAAFAPFASTQSRAFDDPAPARAPDAFAPTVPVVPLSARRLLLRIALPASILAAIGALVVWRYLQRSPLDAADARLACPVLRASGVKEPAGWLGAAAAAVACERARIVLGGRKERTLVPAELLELPAEPSDAFPADPYGQPGAIDASLSAARRRSQAYLDGDVTSTSPGFTVRLVLHAGDGAELGRAEGHGAGLYQAVRAAMTPLVDDGLIPRAKSLAPDVAAWSLTESVDDALAVTDLTLALAHNAGGLVEECERFEKVSPRVGELGAEGRWLCAYVLGRKSPDIAFDAAAPALPAKATRIQINHAFYRASDPGDADLLRSSLASEVSPPGRALLAVTASCLLQAEQDTARELALTAVKNEPSAAVLGWCTPWGQLLSLEVKTRREGVSRGEQAWLPWDPRSWEPSASVSGDNASSLMQRVRLLSPFDSFRARNAADRYLQAQDPTAALGIASSLSAGGLPLHELEKTLLMAKVDASEANFGKALERARAPQDISRDAGWMRAQRFDLAWFALELADLLGNPREVADAMVERFLDPDPPRVDRYVSKTVPRTAALCVRSSRPEHCFERFRALRPQFQGLITANTERFIAGAECYVRKDVECAKEKWRPLVPQVLELDREMVEVFEATHAPDLADQVDKEVMKRAWEYHGATLGHVRAAHRALERGDRELATRLAEQVIEAWGQADAEPPALGDMRRLLEKLRQR